MCFELYRVPVSKHMQLVNLAIGTEEFKGTVFKVYGRGYSCHHAGVKSV